MSENTGAAKAQDRKPLTTLEFKRCDNPECGAPPGLVHGWFVSGQQRLTRGYFTAESANYVLDLAIDSHVVELSEQAVAEVRKQIRELGMAEHEPVVEEVLADEGGPVISVMIIGSDLGAISALLSGAITDPTKMS